MVGTVFASDADAGQTLNYRLLSGTESFAIESQTGRITVLPVALLDYEKNPLMQVRVAVSDSGNPARTTEATIDIDIHNVNEPPTQIEVTDVNTKENLEGLAIAKFKVTDPDANNSFRFSVDDPRFEVVDGILRLKSGNSYVRRWHLLSR